jgi:hypothetical protein
MYEYMLLVSRPKVTACLSNVLQLKLLHFNSYIPLWLYLYTRNRMQNPRIKVIYFCLGVGHSKQKFICVQVFYFERFPR